MAPLLILAATPLGIVTRKKSFRPSIAGWNVALVPSRNQKADLSSCWSEVKRLSDEGDHDGAHIIAFHNPADERKDFERQVYSRHRLLWLEKADLVDYGTVTFEERLRDVARFEEDWRSELRPSSTAEALVLPEGVFEARREVEAMWKRAANLRLGHDVVEKVVALRDRFREKHWLEGRWTDRHDRIFDHTGPRHGSARPALRWKFTYIVPDGFHFDVRAVDRKAFFLTDCRGSREQFNQYTNVDCHGFVYRGS